MTKPRAPLSIDAALARVAGQVPGGWKAMAEALGRHERTVRRWGDPDFGEEITVSAAIRLEILYQEHGGEGWPIYEAYGLLIGTAAEAHFFDQFELLRRLGELMKENGEAEAALLRLSMPDASSADRDTALRELIESLEAAKRILPMLHDHHAAPEEHSRAPP